MKNPKITKDCFVNVEDWTHEEILKAAEVFVENVEDAFIGLDKKYFFLNNKQEGYKYLLMLDDGMMFVGSVNDLEVTGSVVELTKEDLFSASSTEAPPTIYITFDPDNLEIFESFIDTWENNMHKENTTKDLIDNIAQAYEVLCDSEDALQTLQQEVVKNRKDYEDAVEELQKSVQNKGFKVEPMQTAPSKPTKNFDRYSYWDVSEWTAEEVQEAAEILAKEFRANIYDLGVHNEYCCLYIDNEHDIIVSSAMDLQDSEEELNKEFTQRNKQDIL